ncbi:MAG: MarR family transcriptional regulator [Candidatus Woesebacteria bacterium]|jgi:DNA-binding MarR family transcriptional regulator
MDLSELTTYQALVNQSRANRTVKAQFEQTLREHNLTVMQWSVLGFIKDAGKQGIRISDLAQKIDTSLAFITNSVNALQAKGIVCRAEHESDNRAKLVSVAPAYRKKLESIEKQLHQRMDSWLESCLGSGVKAYLETLEKIAQSSN